MYLPARRATSAIGLVKDFRSEKIPRNRLETAEECTHLSQFRSSELKEITWNVSFTYNPFQTKRIESVFSSVKCFRMEFREFAFVFVPHRIKSCFLFHRMVQNRIPSFCFFFCSTEQNSEHFFSSAEWFGTKFRMFYVTRDSPNSAGTNQLFRPVFLGIIFWSEIDNPSQ